jgi:hypothetical protein
VATSVDDLALQEMSRLTCFAAEIFPASNVATIQNARLSSTIRARTVCGDGAAGLSAETESGSRLSMSGGGNERQILDCMKVCSPPRLGI